MFRAGLKTAAGFIALPFSLLLLVILTANTLAGCKDKMLF
jgi:hypothetical protein